MHILCTICSEIVGQDENIFTTKCGHLFHHHCLSQWIARSSTCPQCRDRVTERGIFRVFPTAASAAGGEDAASLQAQLDDARLQLRQARGERASADDKCDTALKDLRRTEELLKANEKKLVVRESAVIALKEQLDYVKIQNKETQRLKEENDQLRKEMQTLTALQKVLNASAAETEHVLQGYADVRTVATFATALKRALCDSEAKKSEMRNQLQETKTQLGAAAGNVARLQDQVAQLKEYISTRAAPTRKRKAHVIERGEGVGDTGGSSGEEGESTARAGESRVPDPGADLSVTSLVRQIEHADSPYLRLQRGGGAAPGDAPRCLKPSEFAILNAAKASKPSAVAGSGRYSIFHSKPAGSVALLRASEARVRELDVGYDGLGGHARLERFPAPRPAPPPPLPRVGARHRLKRPAPAGSQDIAKILERIMENK